MNFKYFILHYRPRKKSFNYLLLTKILSGLISACRILHLLRSFKARNNCWLQERTALIWSPTSFPYFFKTSRKFILLRERGKERIGKSLTKKNHSGLLNADTNLNKPVSFKYFWRKAAFNLTYCSVSYRIEIKRLVNQICPILCNYLLDWTLLSPEHIFNQY